MLDATGKQATEVLGARLQDPSGTSPFSDVLVGRLLTLAYDVLGQPARPRADDRRCVVRLRLLHAVLKAADDPDAAVILDYIEGIAIGVGVKMPRTPAVFGKRRRWNIVEQRNPNAHLEAQRSFDWRDNYVSTVPHVDEVERQLDDLVERGKALKFSEAAVREKWPNAVPASLGALEKVGNDGELTIRLLFDGTKRIRQRDHERGPSAPDLKRVLRGLADANKPARTLTADVEDAHRLVNVRPLDWQHQLCRARQGGPLYAFTVGVFGVSSISYWWGRLAGGGLRGPHYLSTQAEGLWVLLVADDFKFDSTSDQPDYSLLYSLLVLVLFGFPLKWRKTAGGDEVDWVGYHIVLRNFSLGLSERRATWAITWCSSLARAGAAKIGDLRDGLGRLSFAVGALEHERPFLAPLFAFVARHPTAAVRKLPTFVRLLLTYLADRISARRHYPCGTRRAAIHHAPRVDAHAAGEEVGIGGWLPLTNADGVISTSLSPWFSCRLTRSTSPWAYAKGGQPFRTIAALEALAVLYAVRLFKPWLGSDGCGAVMFPAFTDNQGNSHTHTHTLNRLMTSRFPLVCVVMELATLLDDANLRMDVRWTPRERNQEADALANGDFSSFSAANRVHLDAASAKWKVLDKAMTEGLRFYSELPPPLAAERPRKRQRQERLRARDPW